VRPVSTRSPGESAARSQRAPFTTVPFFEPASTTVHRPCSFSSRACADDIQRSATKSSTCAPSRRSARSSPRPMASSVTPSSAMRSGVSLGRSHASASTR
jgi:hypothetical protein